MLSIDYSHTTDSAIGPKGIDKQLLADYEARFDKLHAIVDRDRRSGAIGFWSLPVSRGPAKSIADLAHHFEGRFPYVLVLGIGGSSLGARALTHTRYSAVAPASVERRQILYFENSDPWHLYQALSALHPSQCLVVVTSKSGGTVETAAQFTIVWQWLRDHVGAETAAKQVVAITDPSKGTLRQMAQQLHFHTLPIPPNVGGRYSVLSAAGLFPAALAGINIDTVLDGAQAISQSCMSPYLRRNPAALIAALHYAHHNLFARSIHVMMPYSDALKPFASWYVQLWAESLGKKKPGGAEDIYVGPTPLAAIGATDQHSQLQLFMQGPDDKVLTFIQADHPTEEDLSIPLSSVADFTYLGGQTLQKLLNAEQRGTRAALSAQRRPSLLIRIDRASPKTLGALFFLYEAATAFAGQFYGVNAFDQPGVEATKRLASGLMGRPGYESAAVEVQKAERIGSEEYRFSVET